MRLRVFLRFPGADPVVRDVAEGRWVEAEGEADTMIGHDRWALPGLVDGHAHLARAEMDLQPGDFEGASARARAAMEAGVGLVLDKGWGDTTTCRVVDEMPLSERPDIEAAGRIVAVPGGYWPGFTRECDPTEIEAVAREAVVEGRGWLKLVGDWPRRGVGPVANFTEDQLATAVRVAEEGGARVAIHTMAEEVPSMAVRAGVHSIEHGPFLSTGDLEALGARAGMWVPTVLQVERVIEQLGPGSSGGRLLLRGLDNIGRLLRVAVDAGVLVLTGTDLVVATHQVAEEAIRLWKMGLDGASVVAAVSTSGLEATGRAARFEPGAPAHAVLYPEDPALDPNVLAHPSEVIRWGRPR